MRNLQAIGDDLEALDARLSEAGGDVDAERAAGEAMGAWFDALTAESWGAVDRAVAWIKDLEWRAAAKRAAVAELEAHARAEEERAERVRSMLFSFVKRRGGRFTTALRPLRIQRNSRAALTLLVEPDDLPDEFREVTYTARRDAIRKELESGAELPFAVLETGSHLRLG